MSPDKLQLAIYADPVSGEAIMSAIEKMAAEDAEDNPGLSQIELERQAFYKMAGTPVEHLVLASYGGELSTTQFGRDHYEGHVIPTRSDEEELILWESYLARSTTKGQ